VFEKFKVALEILRWQISNSFANVMQITL